ncbi:small-conductance mechanosensitive channel [Neolewinella xylanilytica]|uniref:Small-conductance mechanosensitive channel n=1 Tax=Neolewinella xylanilytica TaxID=1514080 RepID=A0A2S6IAB1_9BACT|nr:mechanosensitive ion channel domain-containing protein [Neolewinella xylanilytica]PPK88428.1 small-conductance mechanosensitive channel [Neolewinella xylanilytica]
MRTFCYLLFFLPGILWSQSGAPDTLPTRDTVVQSVPTSLPDTLALGEYAEAYFQLERLNTGLPDRPTTINLRTPQAAMEHFILSAREGDFASAAFALNLNLMPARVQPQEAAVLAEKLSYVLDQRVSLSWDALPDRADGQVNVASAGKQAVAGQPRRLISFGQLSQGDRDIQLNLQRVRVGEQAPIWVIAAPTVENIEALYAEFGPTWLDRNVPDWADQIVLGISLWKVVAVLFLGFLCYLLFLLIRTITKRLLNRSESEWLTDLSTHIATPTALALSIFVFYLCMNNLLSIAGGWSPYLYALLLVVVVGTVTWLVMSVIDYVMERLTETQVEDVSDEENMESRRTLTTISVARRVITFVVIVVGIGVITSQFPSLQNLGVSLLASAGLATILLGIAAQPTLGNIMAGLQIAITKPARIGDSVIFEGEYGTIEEIRFTYLVIKTWDARRLIIPLKYFITHPFQNWSMNDPHMLKPIVLHADFKTDVDRVREKFSELLKGHDLYDGESEPSVQVVDSDTTAMEIRCLVSARDSSSAWELHCDLREGMIRFLAGLSDGTALPREREQKVVE